MARDFSRSRAILVGSGRFRPDSGISALPAASTCVQATGELLRGERCGWPADRVSTLADPGSPEELAAALERAAAEALDLLVVYYVGRGLTAPDGRLVLALGGTVAGAALGQGGFPYERLADIVRRSPAAAKLVILDSRTTGLSYAAQPAGQLAPTPGFRVIGAGERDESATAPQAGQLTAFTSALIDIVAAGLPGRGPWITSDDLFLGLQSRLAAAGQPAPAYVGAAEAPVPLFAVNAAVPAPPPQVQGPLYIPSVHARIPHQGGPAYVPPGTAYVSPSATHVLPATMPQLPGMYPPAPAALTPPGPAYPPSTAAPQPPATGVSGPSRRTLLIAGGAVAAAAVSGTIAYVATRSSTAKPALTTRTFTAGGRSSSLMTVGSVIVASFNKTDAKGEGAGGCQLLAWNPDGSPAWNVSLPGDEVDVFTQGGMVVCTTTDSQGSTLYAYDAAGKLRWKYQDGQSYLELGPVPGAALYVATNPSSGLDTGYVAAVDLADGSSSWRSNSLGGFAGPPGLLGGAVLVDSSAADGGNGWIYALDQATGAQQWVTPALPGFSVEGVYLGSSTVLAMAGVSGATDSDFSEVVYGIDPGSGAIQWQRSVAGTEVVTSAQLLAGSLLVYTQPGGSAPATLSAWAQGSGTSQWSFTSAAGSYPYVDAEFGSLSGDLVYVAAFPPTIGGDAQLCAIRASSGARVWTAALSGNGVDDVEVSNGRVYVASSRTTAKGVDAGGSQLEIFDEGTGDAVRQPLALPGCIGVGNILINNGTAYLLGAASTAATTKYTLFMHPL